MGNAGEDVLRPRHQPVCATDAAAVATARHGRSRDVDVRTRKKTSACEAVALREPRQDRLAAEEVFQGGKVGSGRSVEAASDVTATKTGHATDLSAEQLEA